MVHSSSTTPTQILARWLSERERLIDVAELWVSAGTPEHWRWSIEYAYRYEKGYTYWGSKLTAEELKGLFGVARGVAAASARLLEDSTIEFAESFGAVTPHIILFYANGIGIIGAGLVTQLELDFLNLFWPEERERGRVTFPYRYKMRILWLASSVAESPEDTRRWRGDPSLTEALKAYCRSGLQHIK
ncbi:MAG: hypothetical protein DRJ67_10305, partial [Thermoprotei archaeon]